MKYTETMFEIANQYTPEGSTATAVMDQWVHAISNNFDLFGVDNNQLKTKITEIFSELSIPSSNYQFKFIDLFAGIGGIRIGFQQNGGVCVFSSEIDKYAQHTYNTNFNEMPFGDITKIDPKHIPNHDVLLAGFPCQPFSSAGKKLGIEDTRGTLFYNIAKILETKKPKFAVLENVKGLISHDKGNTLKIILKTLLDIGYNSYISKDVIENGTLKQIQESAKKMVLSGIDFNIPQNRQRIFIILWRDDVKSNFEYPTPIPLTTKVFDLLENEPDISLTLSDKLWEGHQRRKINNELNGKGFGYRLFDEHSQYINTISARYYKDGVEVLIKQHNKNPRKLSPREVAKFQGFPDTYKLHPSKQQAYKQLGNSVVVNVIDAIAKQIIKVL